MKFKSKPEAYLYTIYILEKLLPRYKAQAEQIKAAIESIRVHIENHQQDPKVVAVVVEELCTTLSDQIEGKDELELASLASAIRESNYVQTDEKKWENPLGRRFESQLQIALLQNPTKAMMSAVAKVSEKIVEILEKNTFLQLEKNTSCRDIFARILREDDHVIAFGGFKETPDYSTIKKILTQNEASVLAIIMHMHFKFVRVVRELGGEYSDLAGKINRISDDRMYESEYYKERGRSGQFKSKYTSKMGIMTTDTGWHNKTLPNHASRWVADSKAQPSNLASPYTKDLIDNDTPYVAGPSGMASMFVAQMLAFDVHQFKTEKQQYIAAITAYMVAGEFHSLHEVLGPIQFCLAEYDLIPGYKVDLPSKEKRADPPNYHVFYELMSKIDPDFTEVRKMGWRELITFMHKEYIPLQTTKQRVIEGIAKYKSRKSNFFTSLNSDEQKGSIRARNYNKMLSDATTLFQQLAITYALLASEDDPTLKTLVAVSLGCANPNEAKNYIKEILLDELKTMIVKKHGKSDNEERTKILNKTLTPEVVKEVVGEIAKYAESNKHDEFEQPLKKVKAIESQFQENLIAPSQHTL